MAPICVRERRRFFRHRQAYAPRLWPQLVASVVLGLLTFYLSTSAGAPWYVAAALQVMVAPLVVAVRWGVWKRRHPVRPVEWIAFESARRN